MTQTKDIAPAQADNPMDRLLELAVQLGPEGRETVSALVTMQRETEDRHASREFNAAMARVHAASPAIPKTQRNQQTNSWYASMSDIAGALKPIYTREGFSLVFGEGDSGQSGILRIEVDILHAAGHSMHRHIDLPPDDRGIKGNINKTPIHARASTVSYAQRYLTCMIFAPDLVSQDTDGQQPRREPQHAGPRVISDAQRKRLRAIQHECAVSDDDLKAIVGAHGFDSSRAITRERYDDIVRAVQARQATKGPPDAFLDEYGAALDEQAEIEGEVIQGSEDS